MDKVYPEVIEPDPSQEYSSRSCLDIKTKRKPTDVWFFTVFAVFFTVLFCFIGYCIYFGDFSRIVNGYDHCGSVCEEIPKNDSANKKVINCYQTRKDDTSNTFGPYQSFIETGGHYKRICTNKCISEMYFHRCLPDKNSASKIAQIKYYLVELSEDFELYWENLIYLCFLSLALSFGIILLFRFCVGFIVWIVLVGVELACIGTSIALWTLYVRLYLEKGDKEDNLWMYLSCAIFATILSTVVSLIILFMRKKIELVIQLFTEAGKALGDMPGLLLQPIWTFLALAVTISSWILTCLWIGSSGHLTEYTKYPGEFHYEKDGWMKATAVLSFVGMFWMIQFIIGCQHMIAAGAVSKWYFTRDKSKLSSAIGESAYILTRYHLGSVALGSILSNIVAFLSWMVRFLQKEDDNPEWGKCDHFVIKCCLCYCKFWLWIFEWLEHYLGRPAYALVAMYGHSFFKAGRQAFARIAAHPFSFAAINSVGDFVLFLAKVLVFVVTEATALYLQKDKGVQHMWVFPTLIGLFSFSIAHCFVTLYEMTIDTIFICFCEDSEMNDGISKPYHMSRGLMEYVENSKRALEIYDKQKLHKNKENEVSNLELDAKNNK